MTISNTQFEKPMSVAFLNNIKQPDNIITKSIDEVLNDIHSGKWEDECLLVMREQDKERKKLLKLKTPAFIPAGTGDKQSTAGMKELNGLIGIDIDDVQDINTVIQKINKDPYTFASFKSISHTGICILVKIDSEKFAESFHGLSEYYFKTHGFVIDPSCKNISRLRFVSFDPDLYKNTNSKIFKEYPKKESKEEYLRRTKTNYVHTDDKFNRVLQQINCDITGGYHEWLNIGFAIGSEYGIAGEDYFHHVSRFNEKYNYQDCSRQYKHCCEKGKISIGTFYYYAKAAGFKISDEKEEFTAKSTYYAKKIGKTKDEIKTIITNKNIEPDEIIIDKILNSTDYTPGDDGNQIENLEVWLNINYCLKRNLITKQYELYGIPADEIKMNSIFIAAKKEFPFLRRDLLDSLVRSDFTESYNPILNYLNSIVWDEQDRIKQLTEVINSDTGDIDFRRIGLQSYLLGIIESVYINEPNVLQLILAGLQNTGKSYFFKYLLPVPLSKYLAFSQLDKDKDDELLMCQMLLIIDDEYSGKSKQDAKKIKRLLSAPSFNLRAPYGKTNETFYRIATLGATSNDTQILNDPTGNRRNLVFEIIGKFDYKLYNQIDKEQLFAQLVHMHKIGYKAALTDEYIRLMDVYTAGRNGEISIEAESIAMYFEQPDIISDHSFFTTTQIKNIIEINSPQKMVIKKLGSELKRMGYQKRKSGDRYGYEITQKNQIR